MNKIKPQAGQVWRVKGGGEQPRKICHVDKIGAVYWSESGDEWSGIEQLERWQFIPQNDLEWLAVNLNEWIDRNDMLTISRVNSACFGCYFFEEEGDYTRQQWQNMRYKLGLDEKPRISAREWAQMLRNKNK